MATGGSYDATRTKLMKFKMSLPSVPLSHKPNALLIRRSYPDTLKPAQTPPMADDAKCQTSSKGRSSVVLSIAGQHTLQSLEYQYLFICDSKYRLDKYLAFGPSSQCSNCCRFGHPTAMR